MKVTVVPHAPPIAHEIYRRMVEKGLTQKRLALESGVNETYIRDIFKARSQSQLTDKLKQIARTLDCSLEDLTSAGSNSSPSVESGPLSEPREDLLKAARNLILIANMWPLLYGTEQAALVTLLDVITRPRQVKSKARKTKPKVLRAE